MTTATTPTQLAFGYNPGLQGATCAWGARWIIRQDGLVDQVPDRQDMIGTAEEKSELLHWLNTAVKNQPNDRLRDMLKRYEVGTRETKEVVLYEDERGIVLGNPNASAGYFYVVARFHTTPAPPAAARYYTATAPDGTVFFRQTANRAYTHSAFGQTGQARGPYTGEEWRNLGFSGSPALAEKNGRRHVTTYGWRGYVVVPAVEIPTRKEFMRLKKEAR